jgi:hypothetical protein
VPRRQRGHVAELLGDRPHVDPVDDATAQGEESFRADWPVLIATVVALRRAEAGKYRLDLP